MRGRHCASKSLEERPSRGPGTRNPPARYAPPLGLQLHATRHVAHRVAIWRRYSPVASLQYVRGVGVVCRYSVVCAVVCRCR